MAYIHTENVHNTRAAEIILPVLFQYIRPKSVLDIGCGTGTWLKVFSKAGIVDFFGIDGEDLAPDVLQIPKAYFGVYDLTQPLDLEKEFDLVVSLEVAEHLPEPAAEQFVATLTKHSKVVLFSAAIPGQGGQNHLNEQWPIYWQEKFKKYGYEYYDLIRPKVWDNEDVDIWYRQNIFLVCHERVKQDFPKFEQNNLIHPGFWKQIEDLRNELKNWQNGAVGIDRSLQTLKKAIRNKVSKLLTG